MGTCTIQSVEAIPLRIPFEVHGPRQEFLGRPRTHIESLYVRVRTVEGLVGWGEAFSFNLWPVVRKAMDDFIAPFVLGKPAHPVEPLMSDLRHRFHVFGRTGPVNFALSGLDIALWDIAAKREGKPLHALFGGARRDRLDAYASLMRYGEPEALSRNCELARSRGFRAVKVHETRVSQARAARAALGPGVGLMVDVNCAWSLEEACSHLPELEALQLRWLEEPAWPPERLENFEALRARSRVPLAAGENAATPWELASMARSGWLDVIQPSVTKIGGVSEMHAALTALTALARNGCAQPIAHSPYFGPGLLATLQLVATLEQDTPIEKLFCDFAAHPYADAIEAVDGWIALPQGPGLGVEPDARLISEFSVQ